MLYMHKTCEKCRKQFAPDYERAYVTKTKVDMKVWDLVLKFCPSCLDDQLPKQKSVFDNSEFDTKAFLNPVSIPRWCN